MDVLDDVDYGTILRLEEKTQAKYGDPWLWAEDDGDVWRVPVYIYPGPSGRVVFAPVKWVNGAWRLMHYGSPCTNRKCRIAEEDDPLRIYTCMCDGVGP